MEIQVQTLDMRWHDTPVSLPDSFLEHVVLQVTCIELQKKAAHTAHLSSFVHMTIRE
jgi:hypothetical protein